MLTPRMARMAVDMTQHATRSWRTEASSKPQPEQIQQDVQARKAPPQKFMAVFVLTASASRCRWHNSTQMGSGPRTTTSTTRQVAAVHVDVNGFDVIGRVHRVHSALYLTEHPSFPCQPWRSCLRAWPVLSDGNSVRGRCMDLTLQATACLSARGLHSVMCILCFWLPVQRLSFWLPGNAALVHVYCARVL